jgi:hypothetical protein
MALIFRKYTGSAILAGLLLAAATFAGLSVFGRGYSAQSDFLIVQADASNKDFYTLFKSSEYLGKVLSEAMYSDRFIQAALDTGKIQDTVLPIGGSDRIDAWKKMIVVNRNAELGMLSVQVRAQSERDAVKTIQAVDEVLVGQNALFRAGDEKSVEIRTLSGPIVRRTPSIERIVLSVGAAFILGMALSYTYGSLSEMKRRKEFEQMVERERAAELTS